MLNSQTSGNNVHELLRSLAIKGALPHAVLIECNDVSSSLGSVKEIIAATLCKHSDISGACEQCDSCIKIKRNCHPDVKIITPEKDGASIKVEDVREMRSTAYTIANEGERKFYVFAFADSMTEQAQNAFIKILEEPPKGVTFLLLCSYSLAMLGTVRSRCQMFKEEILSTSQNNFEKNLADKITSAFYKNNSCEILRLCPQIPTDRAKLKIFIDFLIHEIIVCAGNIPDKRTIEAIEKLRYLSELVSKNINVNMIVCCLCACL